MESEMVRDGRGCADKADEACPVYLWVMVSETGVSNYDHLASKVGNCKACLLHVLPISENYLCFLHDGSVLVWGAAYIVGWDRVQQGAGFQSVLLDEGAVEKHSHCARVEEGRGGGGGLELYSHIEGVGGLREDIYGGWWDSGVVQKVWCLFLFW